MRGLVKLAFVVLTAAVFAVSCKKDANTGKLSFDSPAAFISEAGGTATVGFSAFHVNKFYVSDKPTGWEAELDVPNRTMTVRAPAKLDGNESSGSIVVVGTSYEGFFISATLFVTITDAVDLSANSTKIANSYIASKNKMHYTFDATRRGDGSGITPSNVKVIWQTASSLLKYVDLVDGKASFYVGTSAEDDDDDEEDTLEEGNALLGAYDAEGKLLGSWHIWVADFDPDANSLAYPNGYTVMRRNLGALNNANSTKEEILASYGLYYQWGRKEPFIGPSTYRADKGTSASMYDSKGKRVMLKFKESDATIGTTEYAAQNPMTFITGTEGSKSDWMWSDHTTKLWDDTKTANDPCPYGWQVAPEGAFAGLTIADDLGTGYEAYEEKFGWMLTSGGVSSLYMGAGRRVYTNGTVQNVYNPAPADPEALKARNPAMDAQPWEGYYWTTKTGGDALSGALYFWFNKSDVAGSGVSNGELHRRANGMSVRCVKVK